MCHFQMELLVGVIFLGILTVVKSGEIDLLGVCDPHKDICVSKYSSCEPFLGNVNGEKYAMVEAKAGLLEVNSNSRRCICLPGFSAVNIGKAVGDTVRLECVPIEGASCYTDGDCNIRNLDCLPLLSLLPGIFGAVGQLNSDSLFAPGFLPPASQPLYTFIAGFLQLSTQFLCGFNRINTIEYKCTYTSPTKQDTYMYGGGYTGGASTGYGFAGTCKRVNRNEGYPAAHQVATTKPHSQPQPPTYYAQPYGYRPYGPGAAVPYSQYGGQPFRGQPYGGQAYGYGSPYTGTGYYGKKK